jgi:AraC-like DNA-binding protein
VASFARVFRKATGTAPGDYRKRFGIPHGELAAKASSLQKQPKVPFRDRVLVAQ